MMVIMKAKRMGDVTVDQLIHLNNYFSYTIRPEKYRDNSMKQWCGDDLSNVDMDLARHYITEYTPIAANAEPDTFGIFRCLTRWKRANHIHKWFLDHLKCSGEHYYELNKENLQEMVDVCELVKASIRMVEGRVFLGWRIIGDGKENLDFKDGSIIEDPSIAIQLLPEPEPQLHGDSDYDEFYVKDIVYTIEEIKKLMDNVDFEKEIVMYSW